MSFTSIVKNEISKLDTIESENISELSAIIRNIGVINKEIKITSENASVARRIFNLLKDTYKVNPLITVRRGYNFHKNYIYILEVKQKVDTIVNDLSLKDIPNEYIYNDNDLISAYLRGLFLGVGSINDPKKSRYHLEFLVDTKTYAEFIKDLLNRFYLNSKVLKRENRYMVYIKEAERIGDFLRIMQANNALFYYEDIRIYRDHKNMTNRLNNCEQANVDKVVATASEQIKYIEKIKEKIGLEILDEKTQVAAKYRLEYPDVSLLELSEIISIETGKAITKSGLYHRLNKIKKLAQNLK